MINVRIGMVKQRVNEPRKLPQCNFTHQKKKLDGFYFSAISCFLRNPTFHISIFITLVYVRHTHLFSTRLSFQITLYARETCFCIFCTCAVMHL